jgi:hypothetical protein
MDNAQNCDSYINIPSPQTYREHYPVGLVAEKQTIGLWDVKDPVLSRQLAYSGKFVSPTHPPHFTPQKLYYFYVSGTHLC